MKLITTATLLGALAMSARAFEYRVGVGMDETTGRKGNGFDPSVIHPIVGDVIVFEFKSGVHSVVQSDFDNPCVWNGKFKSAVYTVDDDAELNAVDLPRVNITVTNTSPLWFFDEAGGWCWQAAVLAVNPTAAQPDTVFKQNARQPLKPQSWSTTAPTVTGVIRGPIPSAKSDEKVTNLSGGAIQTLGTPWAASAFIALAACYALL